MTVIGIDISKWNGNWEAEKSKAAGAQFVFIKSSQATFRDQRFVENWKKARDAGILRSAYHYLDYTKPPVDQAKYFLDLLKDDPGDFPPVVDFEHPPHDGNVRTPMNYLRPFVEYMVSQNRPPIMYTGPAFWKSYGETSTYWYQFPLWIAHYTMAAAPIIPPPWLSWEFWQFSTKGPGRLFGSEALDLDVNRFNGTLEELYALANRSTDKSGLNERIISIESRLAMLEKKVTGTVQPTPPTETTSPGAGTGSGTGTTPTSPTEGGSGVTSVVIRDKTPVYVGPFNALPPVGQLQINQRVQVLQTQQGWSRINSPEGWVESAALISLTDLEKQPTDPGEYMICHAYALNVRTGPGTRFPVVGWLEKGQRIKILERESGWVKIDQPAGWSVESYLKPAVQ
jgi:lysozyme